MHRGQDREEVGIPVDIQDPEVCRNEFEVDNVCQWPQQVSNKHCLDILLPQHLCKSPQELGVVQVPPHAT